MHVWAHGLTLDDIIATGGLTHSRCAKGVQIREVRVTFRFPDSRNELTDVRSSAYSMVVTILGWTWWVLYLVPYYCAAEGPLVGGSTQGEERELNNYHDG